MNNKILYAFAFSLGAAISSAVTWKLLKTKYERIAQEEIDSVKEVFSKKATALKNEVKKSHEYLKVKQENSEVSEEPKYTEVVNELGYSNDNKKEDADLGKRPYVISPDSFGEFGYETVSLTLYADKVLAYDTDEMVEDVDDIVGLESLKHFGEYEDDSVFVRNERLGKDFEILLDMRRYSETPDRNSSKTVSEE